MNRIYNTEIAVALGGIPEALVLKEVAYWCKHNQADGRNEHDGRFWTYNPARVWQEKFPEIKNVGAVLNKLVAEGWLDSGVYNLTPFDRTKSFTLTEKSISLFLQMDSEKSENPSEESSEPIPTNNPIKENITERIKKEQKEAIDRLYAIYPTTTYRGERGRTSTGKCGKDKTRIAYLLRTHTPEQIERSMRKYIEENNGEFLKNFSTFLNNMPEYEGDGTTDTTKTADTEFAFDI